MAKEQPIITREAVEAVLNSMVYSTADTSAAHALYMLALVDDLLNDPTLPAASSAREHVLQHLLSAYIKRELLRHRYSMGLLGADSPKPDTPAWETEVVLNAAMDYLPLEHVITQIQQDVRTESRELLGWSWLYYRYVRVDLDIKQEQYSRWSSVTDRTLRRWADHAIGRLQTYLINMEWSRRTHHQKQRHYAQLPYLNHNYIYTEASRTLLTALAEHNAPCVYVFGAPGIGKTSMVQTAVRHLIEERELDYVIWLNNPSSVDAIHEAVRKRVKRTSARRSVREILLDSKAVIVIDGIDFVQGSLADVDEMLAYFGIAIVLLTGQSQQTLSNITHTVAVQELNFAEVQQLVAKTTLIASDMKPGIAQQLYDLVGGNPLGLCMALSVYGQGGDLRVYKGRVLSTLVADVLDNVSDAAYRLCCLLWLHLDHTATLSQLSILSDDAHWPLAELTTNHVCVHSSADSYGLTSSVQAFVRDQYETSVDFRDALHAWFASLWPTMVANAANCERLLLGLLLNERVKPIADVDLQALAVAFWRCATYTQESARWLDTFERGMLRQQTMQDQWLQIGYAVCLRLGGRWSEAAEGLHKAIEISGASGDFTVQAHAMLELGILSRSQGQYADALRLLQRVEMMQQHHTSQLARRLYNEFCRIALESGNAELARAYLDKLPSDEQSILLQAELHLLLDRPQQGRQLILDLLESDKTKHQAPVHAASGDGDSNIDSNRLASLYNVIGRSYQLEDDSTKAAQAFQHAMTLYERGADIYGYARSQSNLAASYMKQGLLEQTEKLLKLALRTQQTIGDRVGVFATQHNLQHLHRLRLNK